MTLSKLSYDELMNYSAVVEAETDQDLDRQVRCNHLVNGIIVDDCKDCQRYLKRCAYLARRHGDGKSFVEFIDDDD